MTKHSDLIGADLAALAREGPALHPVWSAESADLNVNLLILEQGGVAEHVNHEVDVLMIGIMGVGEITVDGASHPLREGVALLIPSGARRAIRVVEGRFAYLTCHRRRAGLWPRGAPRPASP